MNLNNSVEAQTTTWRALQYFNLYRLLISSLFGVLIWTGKLPEQLASYDRFIFSATVYSYILCSALAIFATSLRIFKHHYQVAIYVALDIVCITLMIYASNGLASGLGLLLVIAMIGSGVLNTDRGTIFFAAVATVAILTQTIYMQLFTDIPLPPNYPHAGLLGGTFFAIAILGHVLSARLQHSEALTEKQAIDIANLGRINEYIIQHIKSGIIVLDGRQQIKLFNSSAHQLLGLAENEKQKIFARVEPELSKYVARWQADQSQHTFIFKPTHSNHNVQASFSYLNPQTRFGTLIFIEDIAKLRQQAQQMKVASLGRLAASIAHEIRNPLGAISHASQLLFESTSLNPQDMRLVQIVIEHCGRVNNIIENVMQASRQEPAVQEQINLIEWLRSFIDGFIKRQQLTQETIRFEPTYESLSIRVDPSQLRQILENLSENALRYSKGTPLLTFDCGVSSNTAQPYLDVIDYGDGIAMDLVDQLFEPFFTTETTGSGLGLYIARELCAINGATLLLDSNSNQGCRFRINFSAINLL